MKDDELLLSSVARLLFTVCAWVRAQQSFQFVSSFKLSRLFKINEPDVKWKPKKWMVVRLCVSILRQMQFFARKYTPFSTENIVCHVAKVATTTTATNLSSIYLHFVYLSHRQPVWKIVISPTLWMLQKMFLRYLEALMRATNSLLYLMLLHDTTVYSSLSLGFCFVFENPN